MPTNQVNKDHITIGQAARISHVGDQAIYVAIKSGRLKGVFINRKWYTTKQDLEEYRLTKYSRENRKFNGERIYDLEKGKLSPTHISKILSSTLKRPISVQYIYYLLRTGHIKGYKVGPAWVIDRQDAISLLEREQTQLGHYIEKII